MQTRYIALLSCLLQGYTAQDFFWLGNEGVFGGSNKPSSKPDININQRNNNNNNNNKMSINNINNNKKMMTGGDGVESEPAGGGERQNGCDGNKSCKENNQKPQTQRNINQQGTD